MPFGKGGSAVKKRICKNQFEIKSWPTGSRLRGQENQREYGVFTKDGTKCVKRGFYKWRDADKRLSETVKIANKLAERKRTE